mmetsp:Transcript_11230/g.31069  ORF Transcript_11230/g.31069 Transcript_11230/m.31069 type:complete len:106 (+) Transcript_11230:741-1058(+)
MILAWVAAAEEIYGVSGSLEIGCDNRPALQMLDDSFVIKPGHSDKDLVRDVVALRKKISSRVYARHVGGHQDELSNDAPTCSWAIQNIRLDGMAKKHQAAVKKVL